MADKDLIRFYLDTMVLNEHLTQWYRALFLALEAVFFTAVFALHTANFAEWILAPVLVGLIGCCLWVWLTHQRELIVKRQRERIIDLAEVDTDLKDCFEVYSPEMTLFRYAAGFVFNLCLPLIVGVLLIVMLYLFGKVCWIWCLVIAVIFVILSMCAKCIWSRIGFPKEEKEVPASKK